MTASTIIADFLEPVITPEIASRLVDIKASEPVAHRILELGAKAEEGSLSPAEQEEYDAYIEANDIVAILQAKARQVLSRTRP